MTHHLLKLPTFAANDLFHVVVESPRGSPVKLKYNVHLEVISISRPLTLGLSYPHDWGFVPSTKGPDGDPIDALVYWDVATFPGVVIPCRALAVLQVEQNREDHPGERVRNDRVIAVPDAETRNAAEPFSSLSVRAKEELAQFFLATTVSEGKDLKILGWDGPDAALSLIRNASS